jgi:hypothetical protein
MGWGADGDLLVSAMARTRATYKSRRTRAEYCHCLSGPRKDHARRVQSSQLPTLCAVTCAPNKP